MVVLTTQDRKWQAESDARSLIEAEEVKANKVRLRVALKEAGVMAKKKEAESKAAKKVANRKVKKAHQLVKRKRTNRRKR